MKSQITDYLTNKNLRSDITTKHNFRDFELFKIPVYKERFISITSLLVLNSLLFNLIKVPIRATVMLLTSLNMKLTQSESKLMQYYLLKILILVGSILTFEVRKSDK